MLSREELEKYKKRLEEDREKLLKEVSAGKATLNFGDDIDSADEEADEAEEFGNRLAVSEDLKQRINTIDAALNKIRAGTYGECERCKNRISARVLEIAPESLLCENCKRSEAPR